MAGDDFAHLLFYLIRILKWRHHPGMYDAWVDLAALERAKARLNFVRLLCGVWEDSFLGGKDSIFESVKCVQGFSSQRGLPWLRRAVQAVGGGRLASGGRPSLTSAAWEAAFHLRVGSLVGQSFGWRLRPTTRTSKRYQSFGDPSKCGGKTPFAKTGLTR